MSQVGIISLMIVDDHSIVRHGLKQSLLLEKDMTVVGEADTGRKAVELAQELRPDVIIMDISMPDLNGIEATQQILKINPDTKIIALSMHPDRQYVLSMVKSGARGYLLKTNLFEELVTAIRTVISGNVFLSSDITEHIVKSAISPNEEEDFLLFHSLTSREREILQLISEGRTNATIARHLFISKKTVDSHRLHIMKKLNLHSVPALTKFAVKQGITSLDD
jgi:DNA-binding NarL/FixJ family response regulator